MTQCYLPYSHLYPSQFKLVLDLATLEGCKAEYYQFPGWRYVPYYGPNGIMLLQQQHHCSVVHGPTPLLCGNGCILRETTAGTNTRRALRARDIRVSMWYTIALLTMWTFSRISKENIIQKFSMYFFNYSAISWAGWLWHISAFAGWTENLSSYDRSRDH